MSTTNRTSGDGPPVSGRDARRGKPQGWLNRLVHWLAPLDEPEAAPEPKAPSRFLLRLDLPQEGALQLWVKGVATPGQDPVVLAVEPPPFNSSEVLSSLRGIGKEGSARAESPTRPSPEPSVARRSRLNSEESLPTVAPVAVGPLAAEAPGPASRRSSVEVSIETSLAPALDAKALGAEASLDLKVDVTPVPRTESAASIAVSSVPAPPAKSSEPVLEEAADVPSMHEPVEAGWEGTITPTPVDLYEAPGAKALGVTLSDSPGEFELDSGLAAMPQDTRGAVALADPGGRPARSVPPLAERDMDIQVPSEGDALLDDLSMPPPEADPADTPGGPAIIGRRSPLVGIDFGTSYSSVGIYRHGFKLVEDETGEVQMPSVVSFPAPGEVLVGREARRRMAGEAQWTIASAKRLLGRPFKDPRVGIQLSGLAFKTFSGSDKFVRFEAHGQIYSVIDICAMIFKELRRRAEAFLGSTVDRAIVAVPVSFGTIQRSALEISARQAGIKVVSLITEPTASLLAHGIRGRKGTLSVFDFGGGTFDFCVLKLRDTAFQVLCAGGEPWLGGDDFDNVMAEHIAELFHTNTGIDLRTRSVEWQALVFACEQAKRELSSKLTADIRLDKLVFTAEGKKGLRYRLSRKLFNKLSQPLLDRSLMVVEKVLAQVKLGSTDVDSVVMSGGTSLIPSVRQRVTEFFGRAPLIGEPDLAVVKGAALRAAELDGEAIDSTSLSGRTIKDVAGRTIGIGIKGGPIITLIERSTPLPAEVNYTFYTEQDGQTEMVVGLYEESKAAIDESKSIGHLRYKGIRPAPKGVGCIDFTFVLDEDGMLHVTAVVEGKEFTKTIKLG